MQNDRVRLLIDILLDKTAREDEKEDAAMDLGEYPDKKALEALAKVASNIHENDSIVDSAAESIGQIFVTLKYFDYDLFLTLTRFAKGIVLEYIMHNNPDLIETSLCKQLCKELKIEL